MIKATHVLIAIVAAFTLSGGAYAQGNNTLARPSVKSPVDTSSGYGTSGDANADSGRAAASPNTGSQNGINGATPAPTVLKSNNSLARPSVVSPAAGQ